jgi:transposase
MKATNRVDVSKAINELIGAGVSFTDIAARLRVTEMTVRGWAKKKARAHISVAEDLCAMLRHKKSA